MCQDLWLRKRILSILLPFIGLATFTVKDDPYFEILLPSSKIVKVRIENVLQLIIGKYQSQLNNDVCGSIMAFFVIVFLSDALLPFDWSLCPR